jgi:NAD(P)-dependent dehydrogenase (short-subunit alcohol dehydrogenase family)
MTGRLHRKVVVVTGGGGGIGEATGALIWKKGAAVVLVDYNADDACSR